MRADIEELARRRGFLWQAYEIYGGTAGFYDYGPLGARLKRQLESEWRLFYSLEGFFEIESPTIAPVDVFRASGHLNCFSDLAVVCSKCNAVFRVDDGITAGGKCPECGGELEAAGEFNLMFQTRIGVPKGEEGAKRGEGYLRPETAQGMFVNFQRLLRFNRGKLPFGVMQLGRAYRNEISPRQSLIRLREFTMAEVEVFVDPEEKDSHPGFDTVKDRMLRLNPADGEECETSVGDAVRRGTIANEYLGYHMARVKEFLERAGIPSDRLRFRQHRKDEMAHYAHDCWDAEFLSRRYGWMEIVGIADRGDYDLAAHATYSKEDMGVSGVIPHVIEPSYGLDRIIYAIMECAFTEEHVGKETRRVLRLTPALAPVKAAVFPLLNREELKQKAKSVFQSLKRRVVYVDYDESGSIGRRYRRQDEIGTPYCVTIDYQTLEDDTVTIRSRDTMEQDRVRIEDLPAAILAGIGFHGV